jgi:hypothetical protein
MHTKNKKAKMKIIIIIIIIKNSRRKEHSRKEKIRDKCRGFIVR